MRLLVLLALLTTGPSPAQNRAALLDDHQETETSPRDRRRLVMVLAGASVVSGVLVAALAVNRRHLDQLRQLADQLQKQADDANAAKGAFLANISHEIRTPLHVIQGYAQLLAQRDHLDPADRTGLQAIVRSSDHLMNIVNDVLELSSIEAGRFEERREPYSPEKLLREVRAMFRQAAQDRGVSLTSACAPEVPTRLVGDPGKLRQILLNLVHNALRHDPRGEVVVTAALDRDLLVFEVHDSGPGLSPEDLDRVFGRFEHGRGAQVDGTGLGLAINRRVAEELGGSLEASSEPGQGTTFRLSLPARTTLDGDAVAEGNIVRLTLLDGSAPRVLIVEDLEDHQRVLALTLERVGVTTTWAPDLAAAHGSLAQPTDAVLLDLRLGDEDGLDLLRDGRDVPPTIVVSAEALEAARAESLAAGAAAFLSKPVDDQSLFLALASVLGLEAERSAPLDRPELTDLVAAQIARSGSLLRGEVVRAADLADRARLQELAGSLREEHPEAAAALERHASAFEYERIQELFG